MLGRMRHRGKQEHRVSDGNVRGAAHCGIPVTQIIVVYANRIGDEHRVKAPAFQQFCQFGFRWSVFQYKSLKYRSEYFVIFFVIQ